MGPRSWLSAHRSCEWLSQITHLLCFTDGTGTIGHSVVSQGAAAFGITHLVSAEASWASIPGLAPSESRHCTHGPPHPFLWHGLPVYPGERLCIPQGLTLGLFPSILCTSPLCPALLSMSDSLSSPGQGLATWHRMQGLSAWWAGCRARQHGRQESGISEVEKSGAFTAGFCASAEGHCSCPFCAFAHTDPPGSPFSLCPAALGAQLPGCLLSGSRCCCPRTTSTDCPAPQGCSLLVFPTNACGRRVLSVPCALGWEERSLPDLASPLDMTWAGMCGACHRGGEGQWE